MRKVLITAGLGLVVSMTAASAASFGVGDTVLASGSGAVTTCADDLHVSWSVGEYDDQAEDWSFDNVLVAAGSACGGLDATVQLSGAGGVDIGAPHTRTLASNGAARFYDYHLDVAHIGPIEGISVMIQE